jgi:hypothetical protein
MDCGIRMSLFFVNSYKGRSLPARKLSKIASSGEKFVKRCLRSFGLFTEVFVSNPRTCLKGIITL